MSLRLCVIGNSHIAALKLGWEAAKAKGVQPDVRPTFFGAPRDGMRHVALSNGCLIPGRKDIVEFFKLISGGQDRIRLSDYDAFLLTGLNISSKRILRLYKTHAWVGLNGTAGKVVVHPAFAQDFLAERYAETRMIDLASQIRATVQAPILTVAEPHWAEWARTSREVANFGWGAAVAAGDGAAIGHLFHRAVEAAVAPYGTYVRQPEDTVLDGILTRAEYNKDASKLITGEGGGTDASHMNAAYGERVWSALAPALSA
ncbi:MAG: hypothetical protein MUE52_10315 [Tabrizicola sp.]|jgi:hypothetical protein|nr:hypothetical protein [Tabrizicola sp.]